MCLYVGQSAEGSQHSESFSQIIEKKTKTQNFLFPTEREGSYTFSLTDVRELTTKITKVPHS